MNFVIRDTMQSMQRGETAAVAVSQMNYEELSHMVEEVNRICKDFLSDRYYQFALPPHRPNIFWKLTLNVFCRFKKAATTYQVRAISLKEFKLLHSELQSLKICLQNNTSSVYEPKGDFSDEEDLCCICFERVPDLLLPCMHIFCQTCIQNWHGSVYQLPSSRPSWLPAQRDSGTEDPSQENRSNCPICRKKFSDTANAWQVIDYLKPEAYQRFLRQHARRTIEKAGTVSTTYPSNLFQNT